MDLHATPYRCFLAIAETRSFGRAAERLNMSQPALSAAIKEFERRLGFALFSRTSRKVELTAQGKLFLGNAQRMVVEAEWANRAAATIRDNRLLIGATPYTMLIPERNALIERFMVEHFNVAMRVSTLSHAEIISDLEQERLELGIVLEHEASPARDSAIDPSRAERFERLELARRPLAVLLPEEHPLATAPDLDLEALRGEAVVIVNRTHGVSLVEDIQGRFLVHGVTPMKPPESHAIAVERFATIFRKPAISLGWFAGHLPHGHRMVSRTVDGLDIVTRLVVLRRSVSQRPGAAEFWDHARGFARSQLGGSR